jgi:hypothetical protein
VNNIKVNLEVLGNGGVGWINLVQGKAKLLALVYTLMNFGFSKEPVIPEHTKRLFARQERFCSFKLRTQLV